LRAFILAVLDLAGELREGEDGDVQLLGKRLEPGGDLRDLLHAALGGALGGTRQELEVVDDDEADIPLTLQSPCSCSKLGDGDAFALANRTQTIE